MDINLSDVTSLIATIQPTTGGGTSVAPGFRQSEASQPPPTTIPVVTSTQRSSAEARTAVFFQQSIREDGANNREQQAVRAYRGVEESSEREEIQRLLGVDEFA
ncbi:MAG: hypothetical protein GY696_17220 [Gammaproteobacteria bacterium]|nr:hypothetical protein [Gammaproteobacteria bacterium]